MKITKAVIPVAGLGSRLMPGTRAVSKCMFPLVNIPVIQHVVEEAIEAGINEIILVVGSNREAVQHHFSADSRYDSVIHYVVQHHLNGLGGAVACAREHVDKEPFALMLGDSVTRSSTPVIAQLISFFSKLHGTVIGVETVQPEVVHRYGIISAEEIEQGLFAVHDLVEKPETGSAPSRIAIAGRYVLPAEIFTMLDKTDPGLGGELQLTDAIRQLLTQQPVYALMYEGKRFDIGNKIDYVRANMEFALGDKEIGDDVKALMHSLLNSN